MDQNIAQEYYKKEHDLNKKERPWIYWVVFAVVAVIALIVILVV